MISNPMTQITWLENDQPKQMASLIIRVCTVECFMASELFNTECIPVRADQMGYS